MWSELGSIRSVCVCVTLDLLHRSHCVTGPHSITSQPLPLPLPILQLSLFGSLLVTRKFTSDPLSALRRKCLFHSSSWSTCSLICNLVVFIAFALYLIIHGVSISDAIVFSWQLPMSAPHSRWHWETLPPSLLQDLHMCVWDRCSGQLCEEWTPLCLRTWHTWPATCRVWC